MSSSLWVCTVRSYSFWALGGPKLEPKNTLTWRGHLPASHNGATPLQYRCGVLTGLRRMQHGQQRYTATLRDTGWFFAKYQS